jgi:hypothetical protein
MGRQSAFCARVNLLRIEWSGAGRTADLPLSGWQASVDWPRESIPPAPSYQTVVSAGHPAARAMDIPSWQRHPPSRHDDLGRVLRVKAKPLYGRSASLDTSLTALAVLREGAATVQIRCPTSSRRG